MTSHHPLNVRDFGAQGVARPTETLRLTSRDLLHWGHAWLRYPADFTATVYHPVPGAELDSVGIQRAIDAAAAGGGGTVLVPGGDYLIAPIQLRSRVHLHLEPGARLWGSPRLEDYACGEGELPEYYSTTHGKEAPAPAMQRRRLISARDAEDVAITGGGQISGQSPHWAIPWVNERRTGFSEMARPRQTLAFHNCSRLRLEGFRIIDAPSWTLLLDLCDGVQIRGIEITGMDFINFDGIDVVGSSNVRIADCKIHTTDDSIVLKNFRPGTTMSNILVTNCVLRSLCNAIKIGTETLGNFEDITVSNIAIHRAPEHCGEHGSESGGINLCALDGGHVRNVNISNVVMRNVDCPIYMVANCRTTRQEKFRTPQPGRLESVSITNVQAQGARFTSFITAHPEQPARNIYLANISIQRTDHVSGEGAAAVPDRPAKYPTPYLYAETFDQDGLPASGFYLRHVENAIVRDFRVETSAAEARPATVHENCANAQVDATKRVRPSWT